MLKRFFISLLLMWPTILMAQKQNVWIDADTGNEVDDIYAIIRLLNEPKVKVVGLSSAHFNNPDLLTFDKWNQYDTKGISTIQISQKLNEAQFIKNMPKEEKLDIICLGALTNIASAVMTHPEIISRIRCYILAAQYDATTGTWNKNEFNVRNDLNAFDYLMGLDSISLYVLPTTPTDSRPPIAKRTLGRNGSYQRRAYIMGSRSCRSLLESSLDQYRIKNGSS